MGREYRERQRAQKTTGVIVNNGNLQYVFDTIVIESLASDLPIQKQAGLFEDLGFSDVASSITSGVKKLFVKDDSPSGWIGAIGNILTTGALFKLHPLLGIVYAVAKELGVDIIGIGKKMLSGIAGLFKGSANVTMSDIDRQGKIAIAIYNKSLLKEAQLFGKKRPKRFRPTGGSKIERLFGSLSSSGKTGLLRRLLGAIVVWTFKTALFGAGVVGVVGLAANFIRGKDKKETPEAETAETTTTNDESQREEASTNTSPVPKAVEAPTNGRWMPRIIRNVETTLLLWTKSLYDTLGGKKISNTAEYDDIIYNTPAFMRMVEMFERNYVPGDDLAMAPSNFQSRKQVVDTFVDDVFRRLKGMT